MKLAPIPLLFAAFLTAAPVMADNKSDPILPTPEEMERLGRIAGEWMQNFADKVAPMMERLQELIDDIDAYEAPEVLPNGDIIIRRKTPRDPPDESEEGGVDL